jgi:aspartyl-tRNA(Asn)/glutamyl-tRNA(Gln) amidotransferase subunit A
LLSYKNYKEKLEKIRKGELSLKENVAYFLNEIEINKHLNAFNFVFPDEAIEQAVKVEEKIKSSKHGKLAG